MHGELRTRQCRVLAGKEEEEGLEEATQPFVVAVFNHLWQLLGGSCTAEEQRAGP